MISLLDLYRIHPSSGFIWQTTGFFFSSANFNIVLLFYGVSGTIVSMMLGRSASRAIEQFRFSAEILANEF